MKMILLCLILLFPGCSSYSGIQERVRPTEWGRLVVSESLDNLYKVSPGLYRGSQPDREGLIALNNMGIKTVINLRSYHSNEELKGDLSLRSIRLKTKPGKIYDEDVITFLKIVTNQNNHPVFVHCKYGSDRTGLMCAVYRIVVEGWSREAAIYEMKRGGYGAHKIYRNLERYIQEMDLAMIRKASGLVVRK